MAAHDTRVFVATSSLTYYGIIRKGLMTQPETETIIHIKSMEELLPKLSRGKKIFIIIDLDSVSTVYTFLNQLVERYQSHILLTAGSKVLALSLLKGNIKNFLTKPVAFGGLREDSYIKELLAFMKGFSSTTPGLNFHAQQKLVGTNEKIVAIASSTGGPEALEKIFRNLPADVPPMLVVQHMPSGFTKLFADRLNGFCKMDIKEAANNDYLQKGLILIAPADLHMIMAKRGARLVVECYKGAKVHGVMPAADVLFNSIVPIMPKNTMGVILTGMGSDGAIGLKNMHSNGAFTVGQNKETSVIYGMPKAAYDLGAVDVQLPIDRIAERIIAWAK